MSDTPPNPLEIFASANGIDTSSAVGLMTVVARGLSTPGDRVVDHLEEVPLQPLHLGLIDDVGLGGDVMRRLLQPALKIQTIITERFSRIDPKVLKEVWQRDGARTVGQGVWNHSDGDRLQDMQDLAFGVTQGAFGPGGEAFGAPEMTGKSGYARADLVLRPRFVVENVSPGRLKKELATCNQASAFFPGGPGLRVDGLSGKALDELIEVMNGVRVPVPEMLRGGSPGATEPSGATVVVEGGDEAWRRSGLDDIIGRVLLVRPEEQRIPEAIDQDRLQKQLRRWRDQVWWRLDRRRWGTGTIVDLGHRFEDVEKFARRNQEYLARCRQEGIRNPSVTGLPRAIAATLLACFSQDDAAIIMHHALHHAEQLFERHVGIVRQLRAEAGVLRVVGLAKRLHARLGRLEQASPGERKGPIKLRDLMRGFDSMRKDDAAPILEWMKKAGIVIEDAGGIYRSGPEKDIDAGIRKAMAGERFRLVA